MYFFVLASTSKEIDRLLEEVEPLVTQGQQLNWDDCQKINRCRTLLERCPSSDPRRAELYVLRGLRWDRWAQGKPRWASSSSDFSKALSLRPPGQPGRKRILLWSGCAAALQYHKFYKSDWSSDSKGSDTFARDAVRSLAEGLDLDLSDGERQRCLNALSLVEWEMYAQGSYHNTDLLQDGIKHRLEADKLASRPTSAPIGICDPMLKFLTPKQSFPLYNPLWSRVPRRFGDTDDEDPPDDDPRRPGNNSRPSKAFEFFEAGIPYARDPSESARMYVELARQATSHLKYTYLTSAFHSDPSFVQDQLHFMIKHWEQEYSRTKDASLIDLIISACATADPTVQNGPKIGRIIISAHKLRYRTTSAISDLNDGLDKLWAWINKIPPNIFCLIMLEEAYRSRFRTNGDEPGVEKLVAYFNSVPVITTHEIRNAIYPQWPPNNLESDPFRFLGAPTVPDYLFEAAKRKFDRDDADSDLRALIRCHTHLLEFTDYTEPLPLLALTSRYWIRYQRTHNIKDLSACIEWGAKGMRFFVSVWPFLAEQGPDGKKQIVPILASAYWKAYLHSGTSRDLQNTVTYNLKVLASRPPGHPLRSTTLDHAGSALWLQHKAATRSDFSDLRHSITHLREALALRPAGHPGRMSTLINAARALLSWYELDGDLQVLQDVVRYRRETLSLCGDDDPRLENSLGELAQALFIRFKRKCNLKDLDGTITHHRRLVELSSSERRVAELLDLLEIRLKATGALEDLDELIDHHLDILKVRPPTHPERVQTLAKLSELFHARYEMQGCTEDAQQAGSYSQEAVHLQSTGGAARASPTPAVTSKNFSYTGPFSYTVADKQIHRSIQPLPRAKPSSSMSVNIHKGAHPRLDESFAPRRSSSLPHPDIRPHHSLPKRTLEPRAEERVVEMQSNDEGGDETQNGGDDDEEESASDSEYGNPVGLTPSSSVESFLI